MAAEIGQHIKTALISATAQAVKEGTTQADIGKTSLDLKELSKDRRKLVESQITELGAEQAARPGGSMWGRGQIAQQVSEMLAVVKAGAATDETEFKARAAQAKFMADRNLELAGSMVKMGVAQSQASEESIKYGKALEIQGKIYNKTTGALDPVAAAKQYDLIHSLIPAIGKEMTGTNYLQLQKYLRAGRFGLSDEATALAMSSFEEMGTTAAVGINQMIKTVGANAKVAALTEQARLGLIDTHMVVTGKVGKQKVKTMWDGLSEANAKLLRENPQQWVDTKLIPALKADMVKKGATPEEAATKVTDPAYVATQVSKLFSDRTAADMATSMVLRSQENQQFLKDWRSRTATMESQRAATADSVLGATAGLQNQLQGVFGQAITAAAPLLSPAMGYLSEGLRQIAETTAAAGRGDREAQLKLATGGIATAAMIPLAKAVASPVMSMLAGPLGTAAALAGVADPATRPLSLAALALQGSAADLSRAANLQMGVARGGLLGMLGTAGATGALAAGMLLASTGPAGGKSNLPEMEKIREAQNELAQAAGRQVQLEYERAALTKKLAEPTLAPAERVTATAEAGRLDAEIAALAARVRAANDAIAALVMPPSDRVDKAFSSLVVPLAETARQLAAIPRLQPGRWPDGQPTTVAPLVPFDKSVSILQSIAATLAAKPVMPSRMDDAFRQLEQQPQQIRLEDAFRQLEIPRPSWIDELRDAPPPIVPDQTRLDDAFRQLPPDAAAAIPSTLPAELLSAGTSFASVFGSAVTTGASAVGASGQTAADAIAAGASGAGALYGAAAVARIQAAVANLNVQVNVNNPNGAGAKAVNTGTQSE